MPYINKNTSASFLFWYFNQVSNKKDPKTRYFALISLKADSPFNLTLKDMCNVSYIQTFL